MVWWRAGRIPRPLCRRMPTIDGTPGPYRFFFYSVDCAEPMHVHVRRGESECKFWLDPVTLAVNYGFASHELSTIKRTILESVPASWRRGMSTAAQRKAEPRLRSVTVSADEITAHLEDGRVVTVPLSWSWRLERATAAQRKNYRIAANGLGAYWPDVDEDLSARGFLEGTPAPRPPEIGSTGERKEG